MSAHPSSSRRRLMRSTVAVAAAGAVVLAPVQGLAQEGAAQALDPVTIRIGQNREFTRVEFAGVVGSRARVRRDGRVVVVRIGATAAPDVSRLRVDPPKGVEKVETRAVAGGTELILTLAEGADARTGAADGAVWLNLYETAPPAVEGEARPAAPAPRPTVPVRAKIDGAAATLTFDWPQAVGAAVFRRGPAVWIVFDTAAALDLKGAKDLGPLKDARWITAGDHVAVRIEVPEATTVTAAAQGDHWVVGFGAAAPADAPAPEPVELDRDDAGAPVLVARMAGATKAVWLTDPLAGDRFAAVTALAPGKAMQTARRTIDLALPTTAHGMVVETPVEDLAVKADGDLVTLSRPGGLTLSEPSAGLETEDHAADAPKKAPLPGLILSDWAHVGEEGFSARYRALQDAAAKEAMAVGDNPRAPIEARMALARFLVGSGLGYEAVGVLNSVLDKQPNMGGEPEVRGLRGAARASIDRFEEAQADFSAAAVAHDPASSAWRGYIAANQGDWDTAMRQFAAGASAIDAFPPAWRARFASANALAALETGDLAGARTLLTYAFSQDAPASDQLTGRLVQARLFELDGQKDRALAVYKAVARAPLDGIATPAKLGVVRLSLAAGTMTPDVAAKELEGLRWRWRGDATELAVVRELGKLYMSRGLYREALTALKAAGPRMARLPGGTEIQADLSSAFRSLFLEGGADGLQPIQALGLFYDFRELTPIGADGDEMVRRLARRLIDVDLLDQAAELLKHQVDERLDGVAKAQVATDLATVYLMDRQPEKALEAIWSSRTTLLPNALNAERRALEARSLMELGRYDHALEVLGSDASTEARQVKAEILWKQQSWAGSAALYEAMLGDRWKSATPLNRDEEARLLRAGIGYSLGRDTAALTRLSRNYQGLIAGARSANALRIALDTQGVSGLAEPQTLAAATASADTFSGWVAAAKDDFRKETGGDRPATAARPSSAAPGAGRPAA